MNKQMATIAWVVKGETQMNDQSFRWQCLAKPVASGEKSVQSVCAVTEFYSGQDRHTDSTDYW